MPTTLQVHHRIRTTGGAQHRHCSHTSGYTLLCVALLAKVGAWDYLEGLLLQVLAYVNLIKDIGWL